MKKINYLATIVLALILSTGSACGAGDKPNQKSEQSPGAQAPANLPPVGVMKGQLAPDFSLKDLAGKQLSLSELKNNVVCILFWATWCPYCVREVPRFKELHAKFADKGFKILAINIAANDPYPRVQAFQEKTQLPYPILYDATQQVTRLFYVTGVPVSIIIDRKGVIQFRGYQLPDNADQLIQQLL